MRNGKRTGRPPLLETLQIKQLDSPWIAAVGAGEKQPLLETLQIKQSDSPRIAAVGAGGKTTVLKMLAAEYQRSGRKPVVTTTTHMLKEDLKYFLVNPSYAQIVSVLQQEGCVFAGNDAKQGRIQMLSRDVWEAVLDMPNPVLVEADGARMLPAKFPAAHEPALPPQTTCVLSVYGMHAVGQAIQDVCFRPGQMAGFLGKYTTDILRPKDIVRLAQSPCAGKKGVGDRMQYIVVLSQVDSPQHYETALEICREIGQGEQVVIIGRPYRF